MMSIMFLQDRSVSRIFKELRNFEHRVSARMTIEAGEGVTVCALFIITPEPLVQLCFPSSPHSVAPCSSHHLTNEAIFNTETIKYLDAISFRSVARGTCLQLLR